MFSISMLLLLGGSSQLVVTEVMPAIVSDSLVVTAVKPSDVCRCGNCDCGGAPCNCSAPAGVPQALGRAPVVDPVPSIVESSEPLMSRVAQVDDSAVEQVVLYETSACGPGGCGSITATHSPAVAVPPARNDACSSGSCGLATYESGACASGSCGSAMQGGRRWRPIRGAGRLLFGRRGGCR